MSASSGMDFALTPSVNRLPSQAKLLDRAANEQNLVRSVDYVRYFPQNSVEMRWYKNGSGNTATQGENLPTQTIRIVGNSLADLASSYLAMDVKISQADGTVHNNNTAPALQAGGWSLWREIRVSAGGKTIHHLRNVPQLAGVLMLGGATRSWLQSADAKLQGWWEGHDHRETLGDAFLDTQKNIYESTTANNGQGNTMYLPLSHLLGIAGDKYLYLRGLTDLTIELVPARVEEAVIGEKTTAPLEGVMVKVNNLRCVVRSVDLVSSYYQAMDGAVASGTGIHYVVEDYDSQTQNYSYSTEEGTVNLNYPITGKYIKHLFVGSQPSTNRSDLKKLSSLAWFRDNARDFQCEFRGNQYPSYQVEDTVEMYQMFKQAFGTDASVYHDDVINLAQVVNDVGPGKFVGDRDEINTLADIDGSGGAVAALVAANNIIGTKQNGYMVCDVDADVSGLQGVSLVTGAISQFSGKVMTAPALIQTYIFDPSKFSDGAASGISTQGSANNALIRFTKGNTATADNLDNYVQPTGDRVAYAFIHRNKIVKIQNLAVDVEM